jgi:hypothetical protein
MSKIQYNKGQLYIFNTLYTICYLESYIMKLSESMCKRSIMCITKKTIHIIRIVEGEYGSMFSTLNYAYNLYSRYLDLKNDNNALGNVN